MDSLEKALEKSTKVPYPSPGAGLPEAEVADSDMELDQTVEDSDLSTATETVDQQAKPQYKAFSRKVIRDNRLVAALHSDMIADSYRMLRARVLKRMKAQGACSLGISSGLVGEGKTLTAANLAISMGLDPNHSTLLIDLDLKRPAVQSRFSLNVERGLTDYLGGNVSLQECLVKTDIGRLTILPAGRKCLNSSELLSSTAMTELMRDLKEQHNQSIIICDLPPLLMSDDALVALLHIDASLLVVREGQTKVQEIRRCMELLSDHEFIGTILNDSKNQLKPAYPY